MMNGKEIPLALSPCRKSECDWWGKGGVQPYPESRENKDQTGKTNLLVMHFHSSINPNMQRADLWCMAQKYANGFILCALIVTICILPVSAVPFIKIDPISDTYSEENIILTGITNLSVGDNVRIDILPTRCKLNQKQIVEMVNNAAHNLPQQKYPELESCTGEMKGASTSLAVTKGESSEINIISTQVWIKSDFLPENYKVYSMGRDVETASEPVYFTVLKGNRTAILATMTPVLSTPVTSVQLPQVESKTTQTTMSVPTQQGLTLPMILISLGLVAAIVRLKK